MREAGYIFEVRPSPAEELHDPALPPAELTTGNARLKASAVSRLHPESVVIGADTLVFLDGDPLGKPADLDEAAAMLRKLVGRTHQVCTGVCFARGRPSGIATFHELTAVTFRALSSMEIDAYLEKVDPLDKAGAYAAQEHGNLIIERVEGSWTNVVGLPMERLRIELERFLAL